MKRTIFVLLLVACAFGPAQAFPTLQLYIPPESGGFWNNQTATWTTMEKDFELWIVATGLADQENFEYGQISDPIYDLHLTAALGHEDYARDGALAITPFGGSTVMFNESDFAYGTPPVVDPMPYHYIYPTVYTEMFVTDETVGPIVDVTDYLSGFDFDDPYGMIFKFNVSTTYDYVHFDTYGWVNPSNPGDDRIFCALSRDAETGTPPPAIPEPATIILFGLGLAGTGVVRFLKK